MTTTRPSSLARRSGAAWLVAGAVAWPSAAAEGPPPAPEPPPPVAPADPDPRQLAEQVRQLAEMNRKLAEQLGDLSKKYDALSRKVGEAAPPRPPAGGPAAGPADSISPRAAGGGSGGGVRNQETAQGVGNRRIGKLKAATSYDYDRDGFLFATEDSEFQLKVRALVQADAHVFQQPNQVPVSGGFYLPRSRVYFSGRATRPIEYQVSFQRGYDGLDLLNAYIDYHYDDRLLFRVGRYKTPYLYEYYKLEIWNTLAPERSLFDVNFQGNRQVGLMAWGELFDRRLEYAVGTFDGARNSYSATHNGQDLDAFVNFKPFLAGDSALKHLNLGGSLVYGYENNPLTPAVLRTSSQVSSAPITSTSGTNTGNVPFLAFNNNVRELGVRQQYDLHLAYFHKGLTLLGSWDSGSNSWALTAPGSKPTSVPIGGYYVQAAYLVTGETRTDNGLIDPLRPFDLRPGKFGLGAFEPNARFSTLQLDRKVFEAGFADPNLWARSTYATDVGLNWYLNKHAKIFLDWQHAVFGQPVYDRPGAQQLTSDLFWFRFQVYF